MKKLEKQPKKDIEKPSLLRKKRSLKNKILRSFFLNEFVDAKDCGTEFFCLRCLRKLKRK